MTIVTVQDFISVSKRCSRPCANLYIPTHNEMDPRLVYMEWIKVRQLGTAGERAIASYCYIRVLTRLARYRRQFLA